MDPALHHVLFPPPFLPFSIFLSGYLESFRLRSSSGVAHCPFPLLSFFPLTHLDIPPAQAALYTTPYIHNPHQHPCIAHFAYRPHFSDEHGLFIISFVYTSILTLYIVLILLLLSITCPPLCLSHISHSLILVLHRRSGFEYFVHSLLSCTILPYFF